MIADYFRHLFDYQFWAHHKVWECVLLLSDEQYARPWDYSLGSVEAQVIHTMGAEWLWLERVKGVSPTAFLDAKDYPTRAAVRAKWDEVDAGWRSVVQGLTDEQVGQNLTYTSIKGRLTRQTPLWEVLAHVVNHGTDHRAQTLAAIHHVGGETLEQDIIIYAWERAGQ